MFQRFLAVFVFFKFYRAIGKLCLFLLPTNSFDFNFEFSLILIEINIGGFMSGFKFFLILCSSLCFPLFSL